MRSSCLLGFGFAFRVASAFGACARVVIGRRGTDLYPPVHHHGLVPRDLSLCRNAGGLYLEQGFGGLHTYLRQRVHRDWRAGRAAHVGSAAAAAVWPGHHEQPLVCALLVGWGEHTP